MFGWDDAFLLSMQAAGAILGASQAKTQLAQIRLGKELENAAFESNMEALRAQNSEESLQAIQRVQENVSSQIVQNAARGVASGAGSALASINKTEQNYSKDEQVRRLNLLMSENQLRANNVLSGLHTLQSETAVGQSLTNQIFQRLPISKLASKFGPSIGKGLEGIGTAIGKKTGFGLNVIGS
jgi:hypothetical protein